MNKKYNSTAFTPAEVEKGLHLKLIKHLLEESAELEDSYNDIHITTDGYCTIIEWEQVPFNEEWGGHFRYVAEDEVVMKEVIFPDNHTEYLFPNEVEDALKEWHKENPGWVQSEYGRWYNEKEQEDLKKYFDDQK